MEASLFLNGEKADLQAFIQSIVHSAIEAYKQATEQQIERAFTIDPKRIYKLDDAKLAAYIGFEKHKYPAQAIAAAFRALGISPTARSKRSGLEVTGQQVFDFLAANNTAQTEFKTRK